MEQVIRTVEQVRALLNEIQLELDNPAIVVGRDDAEEWATELEYYLKNGEVYDEDSEVGYWLVSRNSFLGKDYGLE